MPIQADAIAPAPAENVLLASSRESLETLNLLALRRSTKAAELVAPGPDAGQMATLLRLSARAPDHGKLGPWRFVIIEGEGRARAGEALAAAAADADPDGSRAASARSLFMRAPACVMVVSSAAAHPKIPEWEQVLSAGAVCYGLLIAAHAMGFAGCWLTEWPAYDEGARAALGLAPHERIAGLVYLGTAKGEALERVRADYAMRVSRF